MPPAKKSAAPSKLEENTDYRFFLLPSSLLALSAMCILIVDLILGHQHSVVLMMWAAGLLGIGAFINAVSMLFISDPAHTAAACTALKDSGVVFANLLTLDSFLYEEQSYNYWGHSDNELKNERTFAAVVELGIAMYLVYSVHKLHAKDRANARAKAKRAAASANMV